LTIAEKVFDETSFIVAVWSSSKSSPPDPAMTRVDRTVEAQLDS
jgi:hypothetical protein